MKRTLSVAAICLLVSAAPGCGEDRTDGGGAGVGASDAGVRPFDSGAAGRECTDCAKDSDCGPGLTCDKPAFVCKKPADVKTGAPVCGIDCAEGATCRSEGLCQLLGGVCRATTIADCLGAATCKQDGRCTPEDGACVVSSDGDCIYAQICTEEHKCTAKDGQCVVTTGTSCGDGKCEAAENKENCSQDCGPVGGEPCPCEAGVCGVRPGCPNDCGGCSGGKACSANSCVQTQCQLPGGWPGPAQRVSVLTLLDHKQGCDLDDSGKANNVLGKLLTVYTFVNEHTADAIAAGKLNLMLVPDPYDASGKAFGLDLVDATPESAACDPVKATCGYTAAAHSYDLHAKAAVCPALAHIDNAVVASGKLSGGGKGVAMKIAIYIVGVALFPKLQHVVVRGEVLGGSRGNGPGRGGSAARSPPRTSMRRSPRCPRGRCSAPASPRRKSRSSSRACSSRTLTSTATVRWTRSARRGPSRPAPPPSPACSRLAPPAGGCVPGSTTVAADPGIPGSQPAGKRPLPGL